MSIIYVIMLSCKLSSVGSQTPNKELVGNLYVWLNIFVRFSQISVFTQSASFCVGHG